MSGEKMALHSGLLLVQLGMSGYQIITRAALKQGMSPFVFAVYRGLVGLLIITPFAFVLERNKRPPLTWSLLGHFFLLGLTGLFLAQAFFLEGLTYTTPTFAAAIQNSIPAITFIIATFFGQERVHIRRRDGVAKVVGTCLCILGATIMVFYKGPPIFDFGQPHHNSIPVSNHGYSILGATSVKAILNDVVQTITEEMKSWQLGALLHMGMCISFSFWLVIQSPIVKQYPARLSITAFMGFFGTLQLLALALYKERDFTNWVFPWGGIALISVLYGGLVVSGVVFALQMWCVQKGGAVLAAVYQPAQTIIVAILSFLFLHESFNLGSLIGGVVIIGGLYLVTWGQGEERKKSNLEANKTLQLDENKGDNGFAHLSLGIGSDSTTQPLLENINKE